EPAGLGGDGRRRRLGIVVVDDDRPLRPEVLLVEDVAAVGRHHDLGAGALGGREEVVRAVRAVGHDEEEAHQRWGYDTIAPSRSSVTPGSTTMYPSARTSAAMSPEPCDLSGRA